MSNINLNNRFPGGYCKSANNYQHYLVGDIYQAKELNIQPQIYAKMEQASYAIGQFSTLIEKIPNPIGYIVAYSSKEATQSSRIEGTQTNIEDTFKEKEDIDPEQYDDWQEVQSYIDAVDAGVKNLTKLPLCNRLIKQTHKILLSQIRGKHKLPGEFRKSQNWIGGSNLNNAHFVPPAQEYVAEAMSNLELFIQDDKIGLPHLIKAGLIHYQFETIHPFLDGNGRIGRILISLYLLEKDILKHPILYISNFFENNRQKYYLMLDDARKDQAGVVEWLSFFLDAVKYTAIQGKTKTERILELQERLVTQKILTLGRRAKNARALLDLLFHKPLIKSNDVTKELNISKQRAQTLMSEFTKLNILKEITGYKRNRIFAFVDYLKLLYKDD
jgi:Fic family protein